MNKNSNPTIEDKLKLIYKCLEDLKVQNEG